MLFVSLTFGNLGSTAKERCQMVMRDLGHGQVGLCNLLNFLLFLERGRGVGGMIFDTEYQHISFVICSCLLLV